MDRKNPKIAGIEHFPIPIKDGLTLVHELIVDKFQSEMIILFGSLATGEWTWKSDIDILIVADADELDIRNAISASGIKKKVSRIISPVVVSLEQLNDKLEVKHYFFDDIIKQGKLLYNTGRFSLAEMRELEQEEYVILVKDDFDYWREEAEGFWEDYKFDMQNKRRRHAAFHLHQVVESSCVMVELVYSRYRSQTHDLDELMDKAIHFVSEAATIFPQDNEFQKSAYTRLILRRATIRNIKLKKTN